MAKRVCSKPGCPTIHDGAGTCPTCRAQGDRARRPNGNPYASAGHRAFRRAVLQRDPLCVCTGECGHHDTPCLAPSVVADHWPIERGDLLELGFRSRVPALSRPGDHAQRVLDNLLRDHQPKPKPSRWGILHLHRERVPGCYRCELRDDEVSHG